MNQETASSLSVNKEGIHFLIWLSFELNHNELCADLSVVKKCINEVFQKNLDRLKDVIEDNFEDVAPRLFAAGIIAKSVLKNEEYLKIHNKFISGLDWIDTIKEIQEHCEKFFKALEEAGGSLPLVANNIRQQINKKMATLKVTFKV